MHFVPESFHLISGVEIFDNEVSIVLKLKPQSILNDIKHQLIIMYLGKLDSYLFYLRLCKSWVLHGAKGSPETTQHRETKSILWPILYRQNKCPYSIACECALYIVLHYLELGGWKVLDDAFQGKIWAWQVNEFFSSYLKYSCKREAYSPWPGVRLRCVGADNKHRNYAPPSQQTPCDVCEQP